MDDNVIRDAHDLEALEQTKPVEAEKQTTTFIDDDQNKDPNVQGAFQQQAGLWQNLPRWRKGIVLAGLFMGLFLATLDTSIVATSLVQILVELDDFAFSPWIVLGYMIAYMGFSIAFARLSDIYGRKTMVLIAWILFTGFSIGCALAQTMEQLVVFRGLQGVGGSGMYSMTMVMLPEVVSPGKVAFVSGLIGMTLGCSGIFGPILGGVISNYTTWRWIFYINLPIGFSVIASIILVWPKVSGSSLTSKSAFYTIDFLGTLLILAASALHAYGFEYAGTDVNAWSSPLVLSMVIIAALCWVCFFIWEIYLAKRPNSKVKPVFPMRIIRHRIMAAVIVTTFLVGFPFTVVIITLPERFQLVNHTSSLMAGVYLLPLLGASAIGSFLGGAISKKKNLTSYTLIVSCMFQLVGLGLLSTLPNSVDMVPRQHVFLVILGLGFGLSLACATIMTTVHAKRGDLAAAQGAVTQLRVLGGIIGLTIATTLFNRRSQFALSDTLSPGQISALFDSPLAALSFSPTQQEKVRTVYAEMFSLQMRVMMFISAVCLVISLLTWERRPIGVLEGMEKHRGPPPQIGNPARAVGVPEPVVVDEPGQPGTDSLGTLVPKLK